jgi:hypothetical protein
MSRIIALQGKGNSGKTTTIHLLHDILISNGYHQVSSMRKPQGADFLIVFEKKGRKVGVTSFGDSYKVVHRSLSVFMATNCDVSICACRTYDTSRRGTNFAVNSFHNYIRQFVPKTHARNIYQRAAVNVIDAQIIFTLIREFLGS